MTQVADKAQEHQVTVLIDRKAVKTPHRTTVGQLLSDAHIDGSRRRLVRIQGKHQTPYPDLSTKLTLHTGEVFVTISTGPTPVS